MGKTFVSKNLKRKNIYLDIKSGTRVADLKSMRPLTQEEIEAETKPAQEIGEQDIKNAIEVLRRAGKLPKS